ncbi:aminotransferase class V-fold PLP-dependent enzyme [Actinophytocola gossypii]|uniref:Aminotransferase class V-fold PLP-dependent enzyme n=1 Tax=Actinophytocola gossypii TaxID=2812003 RepID=A0ABT2J9W9_9PSEU|nr:aminotransferase class V-fold PLP-dependent enzyme [Actinophytocola gossypii]MCT2584663.1 aminotransferase class V-fold PLP-dependent enzyme [Actinophytocola gossypii]
MRLAHGQQFDLPPGYLNTASIGVPPVAAADALEREVRRWRTGAARPPDYDDHVTTARAAWASLVGVPPTRVASASNVSQLVGLVAASLPPATRVLTLAGEFTSVTFPFAARGMPVTEVSADELPSRIADHDLVAVSAVQSADGAVLDLAALRAAKGGTPVLLDVTQAAGWLPLDLDWADWVVGAGYKWLLAPRGVAWLAARPEALERTVPVAANWFAAADPWDGIYGMPLRLAPDARRLDLSPVWFAQLGAAASLPWLAGLDLAEVRAHCVALADAVLAARDLPPRGSAIVSLDLSDEQAAKLAAAGVAGSIRAGRTRLAFHLYNDWDDVDLVVDSTR